ncbi:hypothetical protein GCM10010301_73350 [Streptomyces plicatus]|nr:hypothetical protein GCM10010301_73350 [Streptomyces plicatus]
MENLEQEALLKKQKGLDVFGLVMHVFFAQGTSFLIYRKARVALLTKFPSLLILLELLKSIPI